MNIHAIYHRPESNYCFALDDKTVVLKMRFAKGEKLQSVSVLYNTKYSIAQKRCESKMTLIGSDALYSYYSTRLNLKDSRLAYVFKVCYDGKTCYFCEDGLLPDYDFDFAYFNSFQFAFINKNDVVENVSWLNNAVFYQVFVDRFYKASQKNEKYINAQWGQLPTPKSFYGGDLDGICQKLDYITSMNVNALYLTPVFCSDTNHKYDIYDYFHVDAMFGGNDALKRLVSECHKRGVKVVLDAVFNHVSDKFAPFCDVLKHGKHSPYFNWFIVEGDYVNKSRTNYCCFAECRYMPKLNTANRELQRYLIDVATYWIKNFDIDGWRLDVSDEVSHGFWRELRKAVKQLKPDAVLIGENWHNSESFLQGDQFDSIMNYAFTKQMMDFLVQKSTDEKTLAEKLIGLLMRYTDTTNNMMFNLLDCHDTHRFYSLTGCDKERFLCALAICVFMPGSCNLYYGDEILTEGGYDPDNRRTFDWDKLSDGETMRFREEVASLLALKRQPALCGDVSISCKGNTFVLQRSAPQQTLTLLVNTKEDFHGVEEENVVTKKYFAVQGRLL